MAVMLLTQLLTSKSTNSEWTKLRQPDGGDTNHRQLLCDQTSHCQSLLAFLHFLFIIFYIRAFFFSLWLLRWCPLSVYSSLKIKKHFPTEKWVCTYYYQELGDWRTQKQADRRYSVLRVIYSDQGKIQEVNQNRQRYKIGRLVLECPSGHGGNKENSKIDDPDTFIFLSFNFHSTTPTSTQTISDRPPGQDNELDYTI